ncbi:MAG: TrbC/VirB2 family protein [Thermacetogeniaceae bacterium]|jgi:hypothetical protein
MVKSYARAILLVVLLMTLMMAARAAFADNGPLTSVTPPSIADDIGNAIKEVGMPLGGAVLLFAVIITAVQIIISRFNPGQRENAMSNLWYVGLGGIILGGALFFASLFFSIGGTYFR